MSLREIKTDRESIYVGKIVGPIEVYLAKDYKPGKENNPTLEQFEEALKIELSDFLEHDPQIKFITTN